MSGDVITPNAKLTEIQPSRPNWSEAMNNNLILLDAIIGSYFTVNQLQGIWKNSTVYNVDDAVVDPVSGVVYKALVQNTSPAAPITFAQNRVTNPSFWGGYTSPARSRGPWLPNTSYTINDFVVSGSQYAICVQSNVSGATFAADVALGYWSILIDLSSVGTSVLPVPGGLGDSNKFAITTPTGTGYTIISGNAALGIMGVTTIGLSVLQAGTSADALNAIGAQPVGSYQPAGNYQPAGSYQPLANGLTTLSAATLGTYGLSVLAMGVVTNLQMSLGLGTAAYLSVGTGANNIVQLDGSSKLPALDASQLLDLPRPAASVVAMAKFAGTVISKQYNVASITKNGTGDYTATFTGAVDANAVVSAIAFSNSGTSGDTTVAAQDANSVRIKSYDGGGSPLDYTGYYIIAFG